MRQQYNKVMLTLAGPSTVAGRFAAQQALKAVSGVVEVSVTPDETAVTYDPDIIGLTALKLALREVGHELCSFRFVDEEDLAPCG